MKISNRHSPQTFSITLSDCCLKVCDEVKDLGVLFNSHLSFSNHITTIIGKARQRIFLLKRSFIHSNDAVLIKAFKTYILPILEYCSPVWSPSMLGDILRLESVQRSFTKSLPFYNDLTYPERLAKAGICSLKEEDYVRI